jgi:hypothetical protein
LRCRTLIGACQTNESKNRHGKKPGKLHNSSWVDARPSLPVAVAFRRGNLQRTVSKVTCVSEAQLEEDV